MRGVTSYQQGQPFDRLVYLISRDYDFASYISQQITHFGYTIQHIRDISKVNGNLADSHSVAILIDIPAGSEHDGSAFFDLVGSLQLESRALVFISDVDNQDVRMKSLRAGGTAFFTRPVDIVSLIDTLDSVNRTISTPQPSRVLIVEDQFTVASYYQMVLKMAGMDAQIATRSSNVLDLVRDFHPDLILMDTFMADINTAA